MPDLSRFGDELKAKIKAEARAAGGNIDIPVKFSIDPASAAKARAAIGLLGGQTIPVKFEVDRDSAARARAALGPLAGQTVPIKTEVDPSSITKANADIRAGLAAARNGEVQVKIGAQADLPSVAKANAEIKTMIDTLAPGQRITLKYDADTGALVGATVAARGAAAATNDLATATRAANTAAQAGGGYWGFLGNRVALFGGAAGASIPVWSLLLHAVVEFGAVAIPALTAVTAGAVAAQPAIKDIQTHFQALSVTTNATKQSLTQVDLAFDQTAKAAAPGVLEIYGGALNAVGGSMGVFRTVALGTISVWDQWTANIDLWVKSGAGGFLNTIKQNAIPDMQLFGSVLGNLGMAFSRLMADEPGIAQGLLKIANAAAQGVNWFTSLPKPVVESVLAIHGLYIWGGLAATQLMKLVSPVAALANLFPNTTAIGTWGNSVKTAAKNAADGQAGVAAFRAAVFGLADPAVLIGAGLISGALIGIIALMARGKIGAADFGAQMQTALSGVNFSTGLDQAISNVTELTKRQADATQQARQYGDVAQASAVKNRAFAEVQHQNAQFAQADAKAYHDSASQQQQDIANAGQLIGTLAKTYGTTYQQAVVTANLANVRVNESFKQMWQQVQNLVAGYGGVHAVMGMLGADEQAVTVATEFQNSKVTQLNSAWDSFISTVQAPSKGFLSFAQSIVQFGQDAQVAGASLSGLGAGAITSAKHYTSASVQLRQAFNSTVSSAQPMIDSLRTAALVTGDGGPVVKGIQAVVAQLVPLAGNSTEARDQIFALAQEAGYAGADSLASLAKWTGNVKDPMATLDTITGQAAKSLSNLGVDAQNLAQVIQSTLNQTLVAQAEQLSGVSAKTLTYLQDLKQYGPNAAVTQQALTSVNDAQNQANSLVTQGAAGITTLTGKVQQYGGKLSATEQARKNFNDDTTKILNTVPSAQGDINGLTAAVQNHGVKSDAYKAARAKLISDLEKAGIDAQTATGMVNGLTTSVKNLPDGKTVQIHVQGTGNWSVSASANTNYGSGLLAGTAFAGKALGGLLPGFGGGDSVPILAEPGEAIVDKQRARTFAPVLKAMGVPGFASGGVVGSYAGSVGGEGGWTTGEYNSTTTALEQAVAAATSAQIKQLVAAATASYMGDSGIRSASAGAAQAFAQSIMGQYGWGPAQWPPWQFLGNQESGWNSYARNPSSGAAGIGQNINGWAAYQPGDYQNQVIWMANYIRGRYGSPAAAWAHEQSANWYAPGGLVPGSGSGDTVPAMLTPGEAVVPTHLVPMFAGALKAAGVPGFATGGVVRGRRGRLGRTSTATLAAEQAQGMTVADAYMSGLVNTLSKIGSEQTAAVKAIQKYYGGEAAAWREMTVSAQSKQLTGLVNQLTSLTAQNKAATTYQSSVASTLTGYGALSGITLDPLASKKGLASGISAALQQKLAQLNRFSGILGSLRKAGLSGPLIQEVVAMGPDAGYTYAQALLAGGSSVIKQINTTEAAITSTANTVAHSAAVAVYGQAVVDGFKAQQKALEAQMRNLGAVMGREVARWLKVPASKLPHFASGGFAAAGTMAVVGENGPELAWFDRAAQIVPAGQWNMQSLSAGQLATAGGGGGTQYHAHFDGWTQGMVISQVRQAFTAMSIQDGRRLRMGRRS